MQSSTNNTYIGRTVRTIVCFVLPLVAMSCSPSKDGSYRRLEGSEIKTLFADKTVEGYHELFGYKFRSYYSPKGEFHSYQDASGVPRKAYWWVRGDKICIRWEDREEDLCRFIERDAEGRTRKVKIKPFGRRLLVVSFKSFTSGNTLQASQTPLTMEAPDQALPERD